MFLFVTKEVSKINAHIYQVIPFMDRLNYAYEDFAADLNLFPAVHMAAKRGGIILNTYYGKTDEHKGNHLGDQKTDLITGILVVIWS
jgi:hypothetical protein